jgi:transcriptional regulator with XRE-family HTH domain
MPFDPAELAHRVRSRRQSVHQSIREAALAAGVSAATLSRVERGDYSPGRENLLKLAAWLGVSLDEIAPGALPGGHQVEPESTPEAVALHLRADKNLAPEDARVLDEVFRTAYDALVRRNASS